MRAFLKDMLNFGKTRSLPDAARFFVFYSILIMLVMHLFA